MNNFTNEENTTRNSYGEKIATNEPAEKTNREPNRRPVRRNNAGNRTPRPSKETTMEENSVRGQQEDKPTPRNKRSATPHRRVINNPNNPNYKGNQRNPLEAGKDSLNKGEDLREAKTLEAHSKEKPRLHKNRSHSSNNGQGQGNQQSVGVKRSSSNEGQGNGSRGKDSTGGQTHQRRDYGNRNNQRRFDARRQDRSVSPYFMPFKEDNGVTSSNSNDKDIVRIMPLGGIDEIGKNMTAIEYRDEIVVIDCGLKFPEDEMLGIDIVIPDVTFLSKNLHKIKGFFITHGHEDHIGALPYILREVNVPVYATKLTLGLIEIKLREHNIFDACSLNVVCPKDVITFNNVSVEFIKTNHSIADAVALAIHTPAGVVVHTGDFKVDYTPVDGDVIDLPRFAELGSQGVLALLADSTNVEKAGYTHSESTIGANFEKIFLGAKGRIIVATFSSNIHRIQQIIKAAKKLGRKCVFNGRSMENVVRVSRELGYLEIDDNQIVSVDEIKRFRPDQLVIMTTGSQGEPMSALTRMSMGEHRKIQIQKGDMVILSSHPIPGNEKSVSRTVNNLYKLGAEVINEAKEDVHVSGHACQEELKLMQALVRPKYFIPVHGEYRHLCVHAELAQKMGLPAKNTLIAENGDIIELSQSGIRKNGKVQSGAVLVDGLGVGDVGNVVLRDRKHLSEDGIITVVITVDSESGSVIAGPDIISRGFVFIKEAENLMEDARIEVRNMLLEAEGRKLQNTEYVKSQIRDSLSNFLWRRTQRKPMILPVIMKI